MLRRVPFEGGNEQVEEIAIEGIVAEKICFFLNFLVVIDVLLQVEEILAVIAIVFDKLPGYGIEDVAQYRNDGGKQEILLHDGHGNIKA